MTFNAVNISIPLKFEIKTPPRGMIDYDPKALSPEQQRELNSYKLSIRKENIIYLTAHPEVQAIVSMIVRMTAVHQPQNIIDYVGRIFTRPEEKIREEITKILNESKVEYELIPYYDYNEFEY